LQSPLHVRSCPSLSNAVLATTDADACFTDAERAAWTRLRAASRLARFGCDAYAYAMVAAGNMDLVVEAGLKCWDIDAAIPILEGAGGAVTDWRGRPVGNDGGQVVIGGDRAAIDAAVAILKDASS